MPSQLEKRIAKREKRVAKEFKEQAQQILVFESAESNYKKALADLTERLEAIYSAGFNDGMSEASEFPEAIEGW